LKSSKIFQKFSEISPSKIQKKARKNRIKTLPFSKRQQKTQRFYLFSAFSNAISLQYSRPRVSKEEKNAKFRHHNLLIMVQSSLSMRELYHSKIEKFLNAF
jgi:hypothetical protein